MRLGFQQKATEETKKHEVLRYLRFLLCKDLRWDSTDLISAPRISGDGLFFLSYSCISCVSWASSFIEIPPCFWLWLRCAG